MLSRCQIFTSLLKPLVRPHPENRGHWSSIQLPCLSKRHNYILSTLLPAPLTLFPSCSRFFPFPSFEPPTLPLQGTSASSFSLPTAPSLQPTMMLNSFPNISLKQLSLGPVVPYLLNILVDVTIMLTQAVRSCCTWTPPIRTHGHLFMAWQSPSLYLAP